MRASSMAKYDPLARTPTNDPKRGALTSVDIADAATKVAIEWAPPASPLRELLTPSVTVDSLGFAPLSTTSRVAAEARKALRDALETMPVDERGCHLKWAAEMSRRARSVETLHTSCSWGGAHLGSLRALAAEVRAPLPETATIRPAAESLAVWTLARLSHEGQSAHRTDQIIAGGTETHHRAATVDSMLRPLPGPSVRRRNGHLRRLLRQHPGLLPEYDRAVLASGISPAESEWLAAQHTARLAATSVGCYFERPTDVATLLLSNGPPHPWIPVAPREAWRAVLARSMSIAYPRLDLLVIDDEMLVVDLQGWSESFFLSVLGLVGSDASSAWHELAVAREARRLGQVGGTVKPNVAWVTSPSRPSSHESEVDAAVEVDGVLLDFQAKAPASGDFRSRQQTAETDALEQHRRLRVALGRTVHHVVLRGGSWRLAGSTWNVPGNVALHVPITVGVEPARQWSLGNSDRDGLGRVLTTLDHIETCNEWVPDLFRAVYWIDRHLAQFGEHRFVDEIDYLGRWLSRLQGQRVALTVVGEGFILADWNPMERYLWLDNAVGHAISNRSVAAHLAHTAARSRPDFPLWSHRCFAASCAASRGRGIMIG